MKVWIINPYGNIPGEGWREYRSTLIANAFTKAGHEVIWWVSNFEHRSKKFRSDSWKDIQVSPGFLIKLVPSTSYQKHISLARIQHERNYAKNFLEKVLIDDLKPDLIILGEPILFYSDIILKLIRKKKIQFILDIGDLWPELFNILLPNKLEKLGKLLFWPLYLRRTRLFKKADGFIGVSKDYLQLGLTSKPSAPGEVVYWGVDIKEVNDLEHKQFENNDLKILKKQIGEKWVIYAGTLGNNYDIVTLLKCAGKIEESGLPIKILIAGDGPLRSLIINTINNQNLLKTIFLGRLGANDLSLLYKNCDMALSSYVHSTTVSMPIKAYDYFAAGLPIINSLNRDLGDFVKANKVGLQYKSEDAEDMFRAIIQLSNDDESCKQMRINALALAKTFDVNIQYSKFVDLAERLVM